MKLKFNLQYLCRSKYILIMSETVFNSHLANFRVLIPTNFSRSRSSIIFYIGCLLSDCDKVRQQRTVHLLIKMVEQLERILFYFSIKFKLVNTKKQNTNQLFHCYFPIISKAVISKTKLYDSKKNMKKFNTSQYCLHSLPLS